MTDRIRIKCTVAALLAALVCLSGWTFDGGQLASAPLDKDCLPDGTYAVEVTMVKLNRRDLSMANDAVNHSVKLTVEGGAYSATVDFRGLKINNYFGYLGTLMYYGEGFVFDEFGLPQGETKEAEVLATQKDADGQEVVDAYNRDTGKPYPDILRFPLVRKAGFEDGDVPLRVFVPIMES
ncbi:MAG: NEAT domain-containing protein, partial [Clostridiales Family XIII bacterium]|nr:NEAT domain-containing protein [Clostridiales Family XIII bacterium]